MEDTTLNDFERDVLEGLTELRIGQADLTAKMNMLVGVDGTNGRISMIEEQIKSLNDSRARQWGFIAAISVMWTAILGIWKLLEGGH
jgi:uncharacterized BrkB/YihY/UPF0761 family membrane protein